jgi:hypothetical protein
MAQDHRWAPIRGTNRSIRALSLVLSVLMMMGPVLSAQESPRKGRGQQQWREYSYPNDGFAIRLPERVDPHEDGSLSTATFKAFTVTTPYAYTFHVAENSFLTLHVITFPSGCAEFFSQYQSLIRRGNTPDTAKMGIQPDPSMSKRELEAGGYPAVETEHSEAGPSSRYYDRMQCVDKKLYVFTARWPLGSQKPLEISRAIDSFRILTK